MTATKLTSWYCTSRWLIATCAIGASLSSGSSALADVTRAGTSIENTATATYDGPGGRVEQPSNTVTITVDELLDVVVDSTDPGDVTTNPGSQNAPLGYRVTNTGNGSEAFSLTADTARPGDDFDTDLVQIVLDTDGNGVYDPGTDEIYAPGSNDPVLEPSENIVVFIINNIPGDASDGNRAEVSLIAEAVTGTGTPGTVFENAGEGGGDAVVGLTGADDDASGFFLVQAAAIAFTKSATVVDPFGGATSIPGSVITYTLVATVSGTGTLNNVVIADPIPDDTRYEPESITLEGNALTDTDADTDGGAFDGSAISVNLGDVPGGQTRTVTFDVVIEDSVS